MLTDIKIKSLLGSGKWVSERIGGRGEGALLVMDKDGRAHVFYRYTRNGSRPLVALGVIGADTTLREARDKARALAKLRLEHPDLKTWLELEAMRKQRELETARRLAQAEARRGTLADVIEDYATRLEKRGQDSAYAFRRFIVNDIQKHAALLDMRACEITPADIRAILLPVWVRGAKVHYNRTRSYLHAAFQCALTSEHDVERTSDKVFGLSFNPVSALPRHPEVESAKERALNYAELRAFYCGIEHVIGVGLLVASFFRFCIATGGQRPQQILRARWDAYDFEKRTLRIEDRKGRGGARIHLVPLTDRALCLLETVRSISCNHPWPFSSTRRGPLVVSTLKNAIGRFLASEHAHIDGRTIPPFTARDLRRTCKQAMLRGGMSRDFADALQNHSQGGLVGRHYANDPTVSLPIKWKAINAVESQLSDVLSGKLEKFALVHLNHRA